MGSSRAHTGTQISEVLPKASGQGTFRSFPGDQGHLMVIRKEVVERKERREGGREEGKKEERKRKISLILLIPSDTDMFERSFFSTRYGRLQHSP